MHELLTKHGPPGMKFKTAAAPAEFKADFEKREITGYAAVWDLLDHDGDKIRKGAFTRTLAHRLPQKLIKFFWWHREPIGMPLHIEEDSHGLLTVSKVSKVPEGDKALTLAADGVAAHMSFGYDVVAFEKELDEETEESVNVLTELKLYEYGPVIWPAQDATSVLGVKAYRDELRLTVERLPALVDRLKHRKNIGMDDAASLLALAESLKQAAATMVSVIPEQSTSEDSEPTAATTPPDAPDAAKALHAELVVMRSRIARIGRQLH